MTTCYCPQHLEVPVNPAAPEMEIARSLEVGDVVHGYGGCVPVAGHKAREHEPLTDAEHAVLAKHGFPWFTSYWPTIRIEERDGQPYTPSCDTVDEALAMRSAVVKLGIGYYDGDKIVGRKRRSGLVGSEFAPENLKKVPRSADVLDTAVHG